MKKVSKIIAQIIGVLFLFCGVFPLCVFGHLNSGNSALILFGLLSFGLAFFWERLSAVEWVKISRNVLACFLLVCFVCAFVISGIMMWFGYFNTPPKGVQGTVVVLGCEIHGDQPSQVLKSRLDAATDYLRRHPETPVIVAGGVGDDEIYSEAYVMRKYLIGMGIAPSRIYCEERSRNTKENITFAAEIIHEHNLPETILIATDGFHEFRGYLHGKENGLKAYALPVHAFTLATFSMQPEYWVREVLGVLHFIFIA